MSREGSNVEGKYARVCVDISHEKVDRPFQYKVPKHLLGKLEPGMQVSIPFGRGNKLTGGFVLELTDVSEYPDELCKEILDVVKGGVTAEGRFVALAAWMRANYGSTLIAALKTVLPVKEQVKRSALKEISLKVGEEERLGFLKEAKRKHHRAKQRLLEAFEGVEALSYSFVTMQLGVSAKTLQAMEKQEIIEIKSQTVYRNPVKISAGVQNKIELSAKQQEIVDAFYSDYRNHIRKTYLLHGITGSGKTEVYMEMIAGVIAEGREAIVLIPEIALTYQTLLRFYKRFGDRVSVINSTLSMGEKYDQTERAKRGELDVMIGPRSALFTPFPNLGVIVIDEEHENSYKSESMPKYHARETAVQIASLKGASVVLGSATPSLEANYRAEKGEYKRYRLKKRLTGGTLPQVYTVDLREELKEGNRSIFSRKLQSLMEQRLAAGEQSMLFLNRRGYAGFVSCRACGHVMKCPHCDVSLSEHRNGMLLCHYCGYVEKRPLLCPSCGSRYLLGFRAGTEQIEEAVYREFPGARVLRMDADSTRSKESYEKILSAFADGKADVLVGTQMIVKGHDFPNVTLVGILAADLSLNQNDYRAGERTFQLLTQAAGRAGRGSRPGEVVIQTYQPEHYSIVHAANQDYEGFYKEEILYRELLQYPPAAHMLAILVISGEETAGSGVLESFSRLVRERFGGDKALCIIGPAQAAVARINDLYRHTLYLKHPDYERLVQIKDMLEAYGKEQDFKNLSVQFDFDPMNTY